ncbi:MAG: preprotein translocase subunit SecE [Candidatus Gracilibacteria bacterium]|jgi:preprotein translocase SecE subunit
MANFFKDSIAELEHVVWPTHVETKKFFQIVVSIIAGMTVFTYLLTLVFSNAFLELRNRIHYTTTKADISGSPVINADPLKVDATTADGKTVTVTPTEAPEAVPAQQ